MEKKTETQEAIEEAVWALGEINELTAHLIEVMQDPASGTDDVDDATVALKHLVCLNDRLCWISWRK